MQNINRLMTNICSDNLPAIRNFYTTLFDFNVTFESDWFIHLSSKDGKLELGLIDRKNELVPVEFQNQPQGFYITFVVEDADALFETAKANNLTIIGEPTDTMYGQRRLLLKDPDGTLVDVSSPIKGFEF